MGFAVPSLDFENARIAPEGYIANPALRQAAGEVGMSEVVSPAFTQFGEQVQGAEAVNAASTNPPVSAQ